MLNIIITHYALQIITLGYIIGTSYPLYITLPTGFIMLVCMANIVMTVFATMDKNRMLATTHFILTIHLIINYGGTL